MPQRFQFTLRTAFFVILFASMVLGWGVDHTYIAARLRGEVNARHEAITTITSLSAKCEALEKSLAFNEQYQSVLPDTLLLLQAIDKAGASKSESQYAVASSEGVYAIVCIAKSHSTPPFVLAALAEAMKVSEQYPGTDHYSLGEEASLLMSQIGADAVPYVSGLLYNENSHTRRRAADCLLNMCDTSRPNHIAATEAAKLYRLVVDAVESEPSGDIEQRLQKLLLSLPHE